MTVMKEFALPVLPKELLTESSAPFRPTVIIVTRGMMDV
jgi:hypothetical protein